MKRNIYEGTMFVQIIAANPTEADEILQDLCDGVSDLNENYDRTTIFATQIPKGKPTLLQAYEEDEEEEEA